MKKLIYLSIYLFWIASKKYKIWIDLWNLWNLKIRFQSWPHSEVRILFTFEWLRGREGEASLLERLLCNSYNFKFVCNFSLLCLAISGMPFHCTGSTSIFIFMPRVVKHTIFQMDFNESLLIYIYFGSGSWHDESKFFFSSFSISDGQLPFDLCSFFPLPRENLSFSKQETSLYTNCLFLKRKKRKKRKNKVRGIFLNIYIISG